MHSATSEPFSPVIDRIEDGLLEAQQGEAPDDWQQRIRAMFPRYFPLPFSDPHIELWRWADGIERDDSPRPFCAFWPRGRGKSTVAEALAVDLGARGRRTYCMYVSGTQDQADKHVQTIARMLESDDVTQYFPQVGRPRIGKNGSRTWNRRIVTTASGYTVEAIGLNKAVRGQKIDWARPDLIIFDDVDEKHDTENAVEKKERIITDSILPAGAANAAIVFVQNLIQENSIASKLAQQPGTGGAAGYLMDRVISGPFPAVRGMEYDAEREGDVIRWVIIAGESLWEGFPIEVCENELNRVGPTSYALEYQHEVDTDNPDALLSGDDFDRTRVREHPDLVSVGVGVDPSGGTTACGIVAVGKAKVGGDYHGYTLEDASTRQGAKTEEWALDVLKCYYRNRADAIFVERNYGGDMVRAVIALTKWVADDGRVIVDGSKVKIVEVTATRGKEVRAQPVAVVFEQGRGHHVGQLALLEKEWRTWVPGDKESPNRLDAEVWGYTGLELIGEDGGVQIRRSSGLYGNRGRANGRGRGRRR